MKKWQSGLAGLPALLIVGITCGLPLLWTTALIIEHPALLADLWLSPFRLKLLGCTLTCNACGGDPGHCDWNSSRLGHGTKPRFAWKAHVGLCARHPAIAISCISITDGIRRFESRSSLSGKYWALRSHPVVSMTPLAASGRWPRGSGEFPRPLSGSRCAVWIPTFNWPPGSTGSFASGPLFERC